MSATSNQKESLIGTTFADRFQVTGFLGEGGMGRIYLAEQTDRGGRQVALKVLHRHLGGEAEVVARFEREMRAAARIEHPNSVRVHEFGKHGDRLFLVMEFVDGDSLAEKLVECAPMAAERVAHIGRQVAAALAAAHSRGIIHRDLKPDNVMLVDAPGHPDVVKVCDFGLARFVGGEDVSEDDESDFKTEVGVRVGTPHYMPPEYITEFATDHRGDLYALGVLLYEMSTGGPPFEGRPYEVMDAHVTQKPVPPSTRNPQVPPWLDQAILQLLEKRPDDRPQLAEEVIVMLEPHRNRPGVERTPAPTPREVSPKTDAQLVARGKRVSALLVVAGFVLVLVLGSGALACAGGVVALFGGGFWAFVG